MIAGLLWGEFGYRGEDTVRITGEHDDVLRLTIDDARDTGVGDEFDRVRTAGVLRNADVVVVRFARGGVVYDIFENGTEAYGIENFGLFLPGEVDTFCVAASLDVEDTSVGPDMLIVADELSAWVGGEGATGGDRKC